MSLACRHCQHVSYPARVRDGADVCSCLRPCGDPKCQPENTNPVESPSAVGRTLATSLAKLRNP